MKQIFLRHKNGGGRVYGNDAIVTDDTFLDRQSSVGDDAEVYSSQIIDSAVSDSAVIHQGIIEHSSISGKARVFGGFVYNSNLSGQARVWGAPIIAHCSLRNVFVYGEADISGFALDAFVRIHAGHWTKAPRWKVINSPGILVKVTISECTEDRGHIGCWCLPYETWFRPGYRQRIGQVSGWTPGMVEETYEAFKTWR